MTWHSSMEPLFWIKVFTLPRQPQKFHDIASLRGPLYVLWNFSITEFTQMLGVEGCKNIELPISIMKAWASRDTTGTCNLYRDSPDVDEYY